MPWEELKKKKTEEGHIKPNTHKEWFLGKLFLNKLSQEMVLHGSWEPQSTISKLESYWTRQTSVVETRKEETALVSL